MLLDRPRRDLRRLSLWRTVLHSETEAPLPSALVAERMRMILHWLNKQLLIRYRFTLPESEPESPA